MEFIDYSTRYREGLDLVLKGISSSVKGGEKVMPSSIFLRGVGLIVSTTEVAIRNKLDCATTNIYFVSK